MPVYYLEPDDEVTPFPHPSAALKEPNGLLMLGGRLEPKRLLDAYFNGIFPWFEEGDPALWWSPDPRCILWPADIRISRSLRKSLNNRGYTITHNQAFAEVMQHCAAVRTGPGQPGTWINPDMLENYLLLHHDGHAHSIEVWLEGRLVGGLYGVAVGAVFVGESMFALERDASKCAMVELARSGRWKLIDCQIESPHLLSLGAITISREEYLKLLSQHRRV